MKTHSRVVLENRLLEHGYIQIPLSYIYADIPDGAKSLLAYLLHLHYQRKNYPGDAQAALSLRCSTKSIGRWLKILKVAQIASETRTGQAQYTITLTLPSRLPPTSQTKETL